MLFNVTRAPRFVTARHTLQSLWKIGLSGPARLQILLNNLQQRYIECASEKNGTLTRYDILQVLRNIYDHLPLEQVRQLANSLITQEEDPKYRKKYQTLWKSTD